MVIIFKNIFRKLYYRRLFESHNLIFDSTQGFSTASNAIVYRTLSSDGKGNPGPKGDCGYIETPVSSSLSCTLVCFSPNCEKKSNMNKTLSLMTIFNTPYRTVEIFAAAKGFAQQTHTPVLVMKDLPAYLASRKTVRMVRLGLTNL